MIQIKPDKCKHDSVIALRGLRSPYLPEPAAQEACLSFGTISDRSFEGRASSGGGVEVGNPH
jgi:hypothetical protein